MIVLFTLACTVIMILGPGYILWLHQVEQQRPKPIIDHSKFPFVDVIVPTKDEAAWISTKIENLKSLIYPIDRIKIWIVDGGSVDDTNQFIKSAIAGEPQFELIELERGDKIIQLNTVLSKRTGKWILVTDCDAWISPQTLFEMITIGEADESLGVIGATVNPHQAHFLDALYWRVLNWLLERESWRGSASLVTGPCYLFRSCLFDQFPSDVIADDIFVTLTATCQTYRAKIVDLPVFELRAPVNMGQLFVHKLRKACAYMRELFRFMPDVSRMIPVGRTIYLFRAGQLLIVPVLSVAVMLVPLAWLRTTIAPVDIWPIWVILAVSISACIFYLIWIYTPALLNFFALAILLIFVSLISLLIYPFFTQTASYPKVGAKTLYGSSTQ